MYQCESCLGNRRTFSNLSLLIRKHVPSFDDFMTGFNKKNPTSSPVKILKVYDTTRNFLKNVYDIMSLIICADALIR